MNSLIHHYLPVLITLFIAAFHLLGVISAIEAVMTARTPQGSIAWAISLITFPYITVPLYWVFGRGRFHGFVEALREVNEKKRRELDEVLARLRADHADLPADRDAEFEVLGKLSLTPWTRGNQINLLIDGAATFDAIFASIRAAKRYVLVQFYIIADDQIGRQFKEALIARAKEGVSIRVLFDEIGCHALPDAYLDELKGAGAEVTRFGTRRGPRNRLQVNFRNHRKIVVVDGEVAFVGGLNVGDEYLGRSKRFGPWRDTHVAVRGPAVQAVQLSFVADWHWATKKIPELNWQTQLVREGNPALLVLPTGPADTDDNCSMMFLQSVSAAKKRFWIASPYFVPDGPVFEAMKLAARRGVDVRVLLPEKPDHLLVYFAAFDFLPDACKAGIKIYRYTAGFLHEKVFLIDDDVASVGTANLDTRSIRLNFEITVMSIDQGFASDVEKMLTDDFANAKIFDADELKSRGYHFRVAVRVARLFSPVL